MAVFFNVCLIRLLFFTYVVSVGNIFFTSILSETPSLTAVLFEFTIRMSFVVAEVRNIPNFHSATSEVKINIRQRLLRFYRRRRRCRHAIVGHRKRQRYKDCLFFSHSRGLLKLETYQTGALIQVSSPKIQALTPCQVSLLKNSQG